ncbi:hypothetical protein ACP70R_023901 [Stipagrostis hirtigluma subsp. patula]
MAGKVTGSFTFESDTVRATSTGENVLVTVSAEATVEKRAPIDLVAVLDVSGSMGMAAAPPATKPSRLDLLKTAMNFIVRQLHDDDGLAVVAFSDKLVTDECITEITRISGDGRMFAETKVDELVAKGDTAFKPGLEHAVKILDGRMDKNRPGFILLLSDGMDNSEIKWDNDIMAAADPVRDLLRKYPVHTFGFGTGHDPKALYFIAWESHGTYSFIEESLSKITEAFAILLGGLITIVASDVVVDIRPSGDGAKVYEICSDVDKRSTFIIATTGRIKINNLYAGETKRFFARIEIPAAKGAQDKFELDGYIYYRDALALGGQTITAPFSKVTDRPQTSPVNPSYRALSWESLALWVVRKEVAKHEREFKGLKNIAWVNKDDEDEMKMARDEQNRAADMLLKTWEDLKRPFTTWGLGDKFYEEIGKGIQEMVSSLRRGSGLAYFYSWMSSYQMQRATTMGSPDKVVAKFLTPAMKAMVQEAQRLSIADDADVRGAAADNTLPVPRGLCAADLEWIDARINQAVAYAISQRRCCSSCVKQPHGRGSDGEVDADAG